MRSIGASVGQFPGMWVLAAARGLQVAYRSGSLQKAWPHMWHGGAPGRQVGDLLLPSSQTGANPTGKALRPQSMVYMAIHPGLAAVFAYRVPGGVIYRVETPAESEPDPEFGWRLVCSWRAPAAKVVAVEDTGWAEDPEMFRAVLRVIDPELERLRPQAQIWADTPGGRFRTATAPQWV